MTAAEEGLEVAKETGPASIEPIAAPRLESELADSNTVICRCENVRLQDIERVLDDDLISIGSLKRATRLGMGPCQGRYCAPVAASLLAEKSGRTLEEFSFFAPQNPQQPIRIAEIIANHAGANGTFQAS